MKEIFNTFFEKIQLVNSLTLNTSLTKPSLIKLLGRQDDENFISDYIAYLLDPKKSSIGKQLIIMLFSKLVGEQIDIDVNKIRIHREYTLGVDSRVDIVVEENDIPILVIENKIWSGEGDNQTIKYSDHLTTKFPDLKILQIYLSPYKIQPKSKLFKAFSYSELYECINSVILVPSLSFEEIYNIKLFLDYIKDEFMEKKIELSETSKLYLNNLDTISKIKEIFESEADEYFSNFIKSFKSVFSEDIWIHNWKSERSYQQIFKKNWNKLCNIHFEIFIDRIQYMRNNKFDIMIDVESDKDNIVRKKLENKIRNTDVGNILISYGYNLEPARSVSIIYKTISVDKSLYMLSAEELYKIVKRIYQELEHVFNLIDTL